MRFIGLLLDYWQITPIHCHYKDWKSQDVLKYNSDCTLRMPRGWVNYGVNYFWVNYSFKVLEANNPNIFSHIQCKRMVLTVHHFQWSIHNIYLGSFKLIHTTSVNEGWMVVFVSVYCYHLFFFNLFSSIDFNFKSYFKGRFLKMFFS